jgi:phospholipase C
MPGPTWPNRFFAAAASSNGLDHSPTLAEISEWETIHGFSFPNGTIFDRLKNKQLPYRLYGPRFPITGGLKGISPFEIRPYARLATDLADPAYPAVYTVIEPDYGDLLDHYIGGTSQHPLDDVRGGEKIIKSTYETLRCSPVWNTSMLIITWDEHGGFYDHTHPTAAPTPGDAVNTHYNKTQFGFTIYGVRVPAVVVSPLVPPHLVDHRTYDHTSILATVEHAFGIEPLTARDAAALSLLDLATLPQARTDAPTILPDPAGPTLATPAARAASLPPTTHLSSSADQGNLPGFLHVALRQDLAVTPIEDHRERLARAGAISTQRDAQDYLQEVHQRVTNNPIGH